MGDVADEVSAFAVDLVNPDSDKSYVVDLRNAAPASIVG